MDKPTRSVGSGTFAQVFPTVERLDVGYVENNAFGKVRSGSCYEPSMTCSNKLCQQGGYEIEKEITALVLSGATQKTLTIDCRGTETPPGANKGERCHCYVDVTINLTYKGKEASDNKKQETKNEAKKEQKNKEEEADSPWLHL